MIDRTKAKELRELGKTYDEISKELGCSVAWCKLNLKGVTKHVMEDATVKKLVVKAKSKTGITSGDISHEARKIYPHDFSKEQVEEHEKNTRRIRTKVKSEDGTLIRPYWVVPDQAQAIFYSMLRKLQAKDERDQEDIDDLRAEFDLDESYVNSLKYALYSMSTIGSKILKHSVVHEIDRIGEIVEELEKRNNPIPKVKIIVVPKVIPQKKAYTVEVPEDFKDSKEGVRIKNPIDLSDIEEFIY